MKIIISDNVKLELDRMQFNIRKSIDSILRYIPKRDIIRLGYFLITDLPLKRKAYNHNALGAYFKWKNDREAYIELYIKNLFGHLASPDSLQQMLPIQELGLAQTIYHEVGHHVRETRTHGQKKIRSENFAESYMKKALSRYILDNSKSINKCFDYLKSIVNEKGLSLDVINNMEAGWDRKYKEALLLTVTKRRST